jgi:hypothetical protein
MLSPTTSEEKWEGDRRLTTFQARSPFLRIDSHAQKLVEKPAAMLGHFLMFPHLKVSLCLLHFPVFAISSNYLSNNKSSLTPLRFLYL